MKTAISYIISGILLAIVIWLLFRPVADTDSETSQEDTEVMISLQAQKDKALLSQFNTVLKAKNDSVKHAKINAAKDAEIARLKRRAVKVKTPHVDTVLIQYTEVGQYAAYLDSIVVKQDTQISDLKAQTVDQWQSFNDLINASDSVALATKELNERILAVQVKANQRLKRQNRALKIGIVAVPVAVVALVLMK